MDSACNSVLRGRYKSFGLPEDPVPDRPLDRTLDRRSEIIGWQVLPDPSVVLEMRISGISTGEDVWTADTVVLRAQSMIRARSTS